MTDDAVMAEILRWRAEATGARTEGLLSAPALAARMSTSAGDHAGPALSAEGLGVSRAIGRLVLAGRLAGADTKLMNQSWVVVR